MTRSIANLGRLLYSTPASPAPVTPSQIPAVVAGVPPASSFSPLLVDKTGISDRFASAFLGTVLALAFHPIKNRMERGLKRFGERAAPSGAAVS